MDNDEQFQNRIKKTLEQQALGDDTRIALHKARLSALEHGRRRPFSGWLPATALAGIALLAVGTLLYRGVTEVTFPGVDTEELAIITSEDDFELFEELEFYVWFDQDFSPDTQG
ncbi:MAG: hypothetical protein KJN95_10025 [Gammaproteobacteria bacterium]|nr:hypothetical protein [Gammaproteobacteria bacterium]